jgi:hypothetical protein
MLFFAFFQPDLLNKLPLLLSSFYKNTTRNKRIKTDKTGLFVNICLLFMVFFMFFGDWQNKIPRALRSRNFSLDFNFICGRSCCHQ